MSLRDMAQLMISVSDNAATDILLQARRSRQTSTPPWRRARAWSRRCSKATAPSCSVAWSRSCASATASAPRRRARRRGGVSARSPPSAGRACHDPAGDQHQPLDAARDGPVARAGLEGRGRAARGLRVRAPASWDSRSGRTACAPGFPGEVRCSGKTGTLPFVRNEAGVVEYRDGGRYAVAVFTWAHSVAMLQPDADRGHRPRRARVAVDALRRARLATDCAVSQPCRSAARRSCSSAVMPRAGHHGDVPVRIGEQPRRPQAAASLADRGRADDAVVVGSNQRDAIARRRGGQQVAASPAPSPRRARRGRRRGSSPHGPPRPSTSPRRRRVRGGERRSTRSARSHGGVTATTE